MVFGATFACARCRLRFSRRPGCPTCGRPPVSLTTDAGRAAFQAALAFPNSSAGSLRLLLARWAPTRPWIPIVVGLLLATPALHALLFAPTKLQNHRLGWKSAGFESWHEGVSSLGFELLALGAAGFLLVIFALVTTWLHRSIVGELVEPAPLSKASVLIAGASEGPGATELEGVACRATVEIDSLLGGQPCLIFGLCGTAGGMPIADADGGDFDLVLRSGERVMVSLEHARIEARGDEESGCFGVQQVAGLETFLRERGVRFFDEPASLTEVVVRHGDRVTVAGDLGGQAITAAPFREIPRNRVLAGTADEPLVIRRCG